jgi:hypothetical protein
MTTNDVRYTREMQSRTARAKPTFKKKKNLFASKLDLSIRKKLVRCDGWSIAILCVET